MSASASDASRRILAEAADVLEGFRRVAGVPAADERASPERDASAGARVRELERELAEARRAHDAAQEDKRRLIEVVESEAARASDAEVLRARAAGAESRAAALKERVTLMEAEYVRQESLRRAAERATADAEAAGLAVEEGLRRELRAADAKLNQAAAESAASESRAKSEMESLRLRLDSAVTRLQSLEQSKRLELGRDAGDASALRTELQSARAVIAALRQELSEARSTAEQEGEALRTRLNSAVARLQFLERRNRLELARDAGDASALQTELQSARAVIAALRQELEAARSELQARAAEIARPESRLDETPAPAPAADEDRPLSGAEPAELPAFVQPPVDPVLDPGWARLLRLVRPPVESAYAHLRRLSATALTAGQNAALRMAAASVAQASDALSSVELALEDGPAPGEASPALPVLDASLAAWEAAFRRRGVALARDWSAPLPEAAHDPKALRVLLHHVLRNVLEAVPSGGHLTVRALRGPDGGLRFEFVDDGPGFASEWLERRFEPFAAPRRGRAGLGLSLVRRTLRRWGGDAEASNVSPGRGARLTLIFAPSPQPPQAK